MKLVRLFFLLPLLFLLSCKKEKDTGTLTVNFVATANNQPFVLGNKYTTIDGLPIRYDNFKFYISNLSLLNGASSDTIQDAALINFSNENPLKSLTFELPVGSYSGFGFGVGLDSTQNKVDPTNYPSSSPFSSVNGMYWGMAFMYRFMIIEGYSDTTDNGVDDFVNPLNIHTGTNALFRRVDFTDFPIVITGGENTNVNINFDFNKMFYSDIDTIDLKVNNITHTNDNYPLAAKVTKNFTQSLHAGY